MRLKEYPKVAIKGVKRGFNEGMLDQYDWLEWSGTTNKMYCFPCYMMSASLDGWISSGNGNYTNKTREVKKHDLSVRHQDAVKGCMKWISGESTITDMLIGKDAVLKRDAGILDQREYLKKLIDCVAYCQVGGIALRGADETESSDNPGNFKRAVKLLSRHCSEFNEQLRKRKNSKKEWQSSAMQKDMAKAIVKVVLDEIVNEVGIDKIYAILADEATDIIGQELMTIVIRYVNCLDGKISERTIGTVKVDDTGSENLFNTIVNVLSRVKLNVKQSRAQGYDGASNMSGHLSGLAARVKDVSPLSIYTHCCNHRLNLVVQNIGINVPDYQAVLGVMQLVYNIISPSDKRLLWFNTHQAVDRLGKRLLSIKGLSDIRWVYHYRCARALKECFSSVIYTLDMIINHPKSTPPQIATSKGALLQLENWDFVFWLIVLMEVLASINYLNKLLQLKQDTLWEALREVDSCRELVNKMRTDDGFMKIWEKAVDFAALHNIRTNKLSDQKQNHSGKRKRTPKKFKDFVAIAKDGMSHDQIENSTYRSIYTRKLFQAIDDLNADSDKRFNKEAIAIVDASKCLHPFDSFESFDDDDLKFLYNHYSRDFSADCDENLILTEHAHYRNRLKMDFNKKDLEKMTFNKITMWIHKVKAFPLITKLLKLVCVIPSSTATCERNFSGLNFIKNKLRNKLGNDFLDDLMLGFLEKDLVNKVLNDEATRNKVVDAFKDLGCNTGGNKRSRKDYI